jgi:hypothetical protein
LDADNGPSLADPRQANPRSASPLLSLNRVFSGERSCPVIDLCSISRQINSKKNPADSPSGKKANKNMAKPLIAWTLSAAGHHLTKNV